MLGVRLKELRERDGYVQRQIAATLEVDTAFISKVENEEKLLSKIHLKKLAHIYNVQESELITLWLSDKIFETLKEEANAAESLLLTLKRIKK